MHKELHLEVQKCLASQKRSLYARQPTKEVLLTCARQ